MPILRRADQRERVLAAARDIGREQQRLAVAGAPRIKPAPGVTPPRPAGLAGTGRGAREMPVMLDGAQVGKVRPGREGLAVELAVAAETDLDRLLAQLRATVLESRRNAADITSA
jgi:ParB family chromosome partitioning protein